MQKRSNANPLIRSSAILRGIATAITLTSLSGMTAFAATHVQNTNAPLQPTASAPQASTPATTASRSTTTSSSSRTQRRTTITSGVGTTTSSARTKTAQS